ncbi:MAG: (2Fe-2S)-binding protein [Labilithrix sp.]|nr:(2Fe-2S)-binding protein [Labilithrix sp.]MCW5810116.1 (2Fe-2S)-binding protein [Labilithrix sp.]
MPRTRSLVHPVTITLDGEKVQAEAGEPVAAALVAAGKTTIARSPKFHRPRGPSCMRGACDGCLARVDETPNVMTCLVPARDGMTIVTQNRLGPRDVDLLRMTDWFFPDGMNHHELFAGIPGIQTIMQGFARRVAGLGKLPAAAEAPRTSARRSADCVVVGAGPAGMAAAVELAKAGRAVEVLDDKLAPGGGITALGPKDAARFDAIKRPFDAAVAEEKIRLRLQTTAGAVYGKDLLVASEADGAEVLEARAVVLACGAHDGVLAFEGNDLPGVMSARAAGWLLSHGVVPGARIAVVVAKGGGPFGEAYARAVGKAAAVQVVRGEPIAIRGTSKVKGVRVRSASGDGEVDADAVLIDAARSPAFELCEQAGATVAHEPRGFVVRAGDDGRIADGYWVAGEVSGTAFDPKAIEAEARRVAASITASPPR